MSSRLLELIPQYYDRISPASNGILEKTIDLAEAYRHPVVSGLHLAVSILREPSSVQLLLPYNIDTLASADQIEARFYLFARQYHYTIKPSASYLNILSQSTRVVSENQSIEPPHLLAGTLLERGLGGLSINPEKLQDQADLVSAVKLSFQDDSAPFYPDLKHKYAEIDPQLLILLAGGLSNSQIAQKLKIDPQLCETRTKRLNLMGILPSIESTEQTDKVRLRQQVVDLRIAGLTNRQIAERLKIKSGQVDQMLREAMLENGDIRKRLPRRTPEEVEKVKQDLIRLKNDPRNLQLTEIATILGVPVTNISGYITNLIKEGKIPSRSSQRISDEILDEYFRLRESGLSNPQIADQMGVSKYKVEKYAKKLMKRGRIKSKKL